MFEPCTYGRHAYLDRAVRAEVAVTTANLLPPPGSTPARTDIACMQGIHVEEDLIRRCLGIRRDVDATKRN
jgi:hypothetical protein